MSHGYRAVGWTPHKKVYDAVLAGGVVLYLTLFVGVGIALDANATIETQLIRALGTCALLLLHVILAIGPLARLDRRFLPLLYNRRHLGVTMFTVALGHAVFGIVQFHALGDVNPLVSLLISNTQYQSVSQFPFEVAGFGRAPHPVRDGGDQPRLLARQPHRAGVEVAAHAGLRGVRADRPPRGARRAASGASSRVGGTARRRNGRSRDAARSRRHARACRRSRL